jgi:hypothetical protein
MPKPVKIGGGGTLFIGTDKLITIQVKDKTGNLLDVTGFNFNFVVKTTVGAETPTLEKAATITGTFGDGSQLVQIQLTDADTGVANFSPKTYKYSLKRTDDGSEDIYAHGDFVIEKATQY